MLKVKSMELVHLLGLMEVLIKVNFMKTTLKAKEFINGLMAENMKVNGKTTKWKDMAFLHGQMVENMKETT
jgi:hypothetical protein